MLLGNSYQNNFYFKDEIKKAVKFQEKYFKSKIIMKDNIR